MTPDLVFAGQARNWPTLLTVLGVWTALLLAMVLVDASVWLAGLIALFTLPAVYDLWANPRAELRLGDNRLRWTAPRATADIALAEIDHVRLDTRLDMSVRATLVLSNGRKLRIPVPAMPPHRTFETALMAHGVTVRRHHFSLMQ